VLCTWHRSAIKKQQGAGNVNRKEISDQQPQRSQEGIGNQAGSKQGSLDKDSRNQSRQLQTGEQCDTPKFGQN